jgi:hypothetical protein
MSAAKPPTTPPNSPAVRPEVAPAAPPPRPRALQADYAAAESVARRLLFEDEDDEKKEFVLDTSSLSASSDSDV